MPHSNRYINLEEQKEALKPWIYKIKKIIKVRGKLYKEMVRQKDTVMHKEKDIYTEI